MIKLLKNKNGSALTYVLIIMMLLSILGLALVSSTMTNYKIHKTTTGLNKSYYINDGAIEEALAELGEVAHRAEVDATNWIADPASSFRSEDRWKDFFDIINLKLETDEISEEEATRMTEKAYSREFTKRFYMYFLENQDPLASSTADIFSTDYSLFDLSGNFVEDNELTLNGNLSFNSTFLAFIQNVSFEPEANADFTAADLNDITLTIDTSSNRANITIVSTGRYNDYNKQITCNLDMVPPEYNYVVSTTSKKLKILKNDLLDNAIASYGDILVDGGSVTVNGNVYSYGTFPELYKNYSELGGVIIGMNNVNVTPILSSVGVMQLSDIADDGASGELTVNGDLKTRTAIKINGIDSKLNVSKSIYANTFSSEKNSNNFIGNVDENVYLLEDLMFLGNNSSFTVGAAEGVEGTIWTLLENNPNGVNGINRNLSGSIIIDKNSSNTLLKSNKYMISGVAYLDMYRVLSADSYAFYQTGLSFTTNRNNEFYASKISSTDKSTDYFDYNFASDPSITVPLVETIDPLGNIKDDVNYKSIHFIEKNNEILDGTETGLGSVSDEDKQLYSITSLPERKPGDTIARSNYALGVMIGNNKMFNPYKIDSTDPSMDDTFVNIDPNDFAKGRLALFPTFDIKTNLLGTRTYNDSKNSNSRLSQLVDLSSNITSITNPDNFIIINNEERDVYINVPKSDADKIRAKDNDAIIILNDTSFMNMKGMIIATGNVFINNSSSTKFVFNGPIISSKSIVLYGSGEKEINNSNPADNYNDNLVEILIKNRSVFDATHSDEGRLIEILDNTKTISGDIKVGVNTNSTTILPSINSNVNFEGIIRTDESDPIKINSWSER